MSERRATVERNTLETQIRVSVNLDGTGVSKLDTGLPFLEHMLDQVARHGLIDLEIEAKGDLHIDAHHTVEDIGITLGQALARAWGDKKGVRRYGHAYVPLDEALSRVVIDLSGRSCMVLQAAFQDAQVGDFPAALLREFLRAVAGHGRMNLHVDLLRGSDTHHSIEAVFKAFGQALDQASLHSGRVKGIPSTKGRL